MRGRDGAGARRGGEGEEQVPPFGAPGPRAARPDGTGSTAVEAPPGKEGIWEHQMDTRRHLLFANGGDPRDVPSRGRPSGH